MTEPALTGASKQLTRDEIYLIGLFVIVWNEAEFLIQMAVLTALKSNLDEMSGIMSGHNVIPKIEMFSKVVTQRVSDEALKKEAAQCAKLMKKMNDFRIRVVHSFWAFNESTKTPDGQNALYGKSSITTKDIRAKYDELRVLVVRLGRIVATMHGFPVPDLTK